MGLGRSLLSRLREAAGQRRHERREVFHGLRWMVRTGSLWRYLPKDLPPWATVFPQTPRWRTAGYLEAIVHALRALLRMAAGRPPDPSAVILDSRTLPSSPESGPRAGSEGAKRKKGSKRHAAIETLGPRLAAPVTPANEQDRAHGAGLADKAQDATEETIELACVDQRETGAEPAAQAQARGLCREVIKRPEARRGFVLRPRRWG